MTEPSPPTEPALGTQTFTILNGPLQPVGERSEKLERPGRDGIRLRTIGTAPKEATLQSVDFPSSGSAADTLITAYGALKGTSVTMVTAFLDSISDVFILDVQIVSKQACILDGAAAVRVEAQWTVLLTA